jgi:hypothetical protein
VPKSLLLATTLRKALDHGFDEEMVEEDGLAHFKVDFIHLVLVKNMSELLSQLLCFVTREFNRRKRVFAGHHVVVDQLVKIPTLVSLKYHGEVVAIPVAIVASLRYMRLYTIINL